MRRAASVFSFSDFATRELKKVGAGRHCSTHRLGATCEKCEKAISGCCEAAVRPAESRLSLSELAPRVLKKVGAGHYCSKHRLGATCDYVKKQLVPIVRSVWVWRSPD